MGPLAGKPAVAHVETVVRGVDDDRIVRQAFFLENLRKRPMALSMPVVMRR